uniref:FAR1 domain-containing protein n=1 Tax=Schistocephalus solidus TaxID=70667 RepID=A0A0X3PYJ3_SCHSO
MSLSHRLQTLTVCSLSSQLPIATETQYIHTGLILYFVYNSGNFYKIYRGHCGCNFGAFTWILLNSFFKTFVSMSFHSYDELKQRVTEFERSTGLCYKMRRSNKFDRRYSAHERELLQYKALTFACKNYLRRENPCKSILDVRAVGDLLTVTRICMIHNHEVEEKNTIEDSYHECYRCTLCDP